MAKIKIPSARNRFPMKALKNLLFMYMRQKGGSIEEQDLIDAFKNRHPAQRLQNAIDELKQEGKFEAA